MLSQRDRTQKVTVSSQHLVEAVRHSAGVLSLTQTNAYGQWSLEYHEEGRKVTATGWCPSVALANARLKIREVRHD